MIIYTLYFEETKTKVIEADVEENERQEKFQHHLISWRENWVLRVIDPKPIFFWNFIVSDKRNHNERHSIFFSIKSWWWSLLSKRESLTHSLNTFIEDLFSLVINCLFFSWVLVYFAAWLYFETHPLQLLFRNSISSLPPPFIYAQVFVE